MRCTSSTGVRCCVTPDGTGWRPTGVPSVTAAPRCPPDPARTAISTALFGHFANQVALFWRDKRISDVMRERAYDPSFGSIAVVRRAGLDLRNNLKFTSYGHVNVLRVEVMQLLDEAYRILGSDDIKRIFGADTAWDVIEIILAQYFGERLVTSPRQRMAIAGRELFRWLAQPHVLQTQRTQFETLLLEIAEYAEEWLTSAQSMGVAVRQEDRRVMPWDRSNLPAGGGERVARPPLPRRPLPPIARTGGTRGRARPRGQGPGGERHPAVTNMAPSPG